MELQKIIEIVNDFFDVDIRTKKRTREIVMIRAAYYYIAREKTKCSMEKIAKEIGRNHATVLHSLKNFENWLIYEPEYKQKFEKLKKIVFNELTIEEFQEKKLKFKYKMIKIAKELLINEINIIKKRQNG